MRALEELLSLTQQFSFWPRTRSARRLSYVVPALAGFHGATG